jgi:HCOMODA/2-hydroxy-3-carboxy-muconic semialdehyde decarboxylase
LRIARALQGQNGVLLRGHGAVVVGASLEQAVLRAIYLEFEARAQIVSRNAGEPIFYTSTESNIFGGSHPNSRATEHAWRYYSDKAQLTSAGREASHQHEKLNQGEAK